MPTSSAAANAMMMGSALNRLDKPMIEIQVPSPSIRNAEAKVSSEKIMGKERFGKFSLSLVAAGQHQREGERTPFEDRPEMDQAAKSPTPVNL
ncbi:MAG: hypothetical protein IPP85_05930 [Propionivibrio sp.]|nr:hypothetical protein [Propionivibrio sp.]